MVTFNVFLIYSRTILWMSTTTILSNLRYVSSAASELVLIKKICNVFPLSWKRNLRFQKPEISSSAPSYRNNFQKLAGKSSFFHIHCTEKWLYSDMNVLYKLSKQWKDSTLGKKNQTQSVDILQHFIFIKQVLKKKKKSESFRVQSSIFPS